MQKRSQRRRFKIVNGIEIEIVFAIRCLRGIDQRRVKTNKYRCGFVDI